MMELEPWSWSSDGKTLLLMDFAISGGVMQYAIEALPLEGDRKLRPLLKEKYAQVLPKISPDGRWMAYESNESGKREVYVRPFPEVNKGQVAGFYQWRQCPLWSPNGRELFYRNGDSVMAVAVETEPTFKPGKSEVLFQGKYVSRLGANPWDISPDGKRFLMMKAVASTVQSPRRRPPQNQHRPELV